MLQRLPYVLTFALASMLALPVLVVLGSWLQGSGESFALLGAMLQTVLPDYAGTTLLLCLLVAVGVMVVGVTAAVCVTLFEFRGRALMEWALLLPLAMPAYVVAYAYTDFLQFSGPLQTGLRSATGLQGRMFPEIRNVWGAAWVFVFTLYPYVYLLVRSALSERAAHLMEAARLLGAPWRKRILRVALPMARPAIAAGMALALMETLADFGVSSYFGIQTFTAGVYKAWLVLDNRVAAAQLATVLLLCVAGLLVWEARAQQRLRFALGRADRAGSSENQPLLLSGLPAAGVCLLCATPWVLGFVLPVGFMLRPLSADWSVLPWARFAEWAGNSLRLGLLTAALAVGAAWGLAFLQRMRPDGMTRLVVRLVSLGYAVPGAVVVVGLLLPLGWLQHLLPALQPGYWMTATALGLVWAYLVRFCAVALQSVQSGYSRLSRSLDESARTLGVSGFGLLRRVHWPILRRSTIAAALLVLVDVMKELPATMVLRPFNSDTLAVVAYQLARDERLGEAALPSLALVLVGLVPVILLSRALRQPGAPVAAC